jgi:uncharacterized repeat protein (TIGR03803 family)
MTNKKYSIFAVFTVLIVTGAVFFSLANSAQAASSFSLLHDFAGGTDDGSNPYGSLTLSGSKFYGMTSTGGDSSVGTIFSINTDGTGFTLLYEFNGVADDSANPYGSLTLSGSKLYGTAANDLNTPACTIFSINTDGTGFTLLHDFAGGNDDGANPFGSLTLSGSKLYGTTLGGGDSSSGTIFSINTDGTGFTLLHEFAGGADDGAEPYGDLTLSGSTLYGMTSAGGDSSLGTIFSINTDGTGFTLLHEFAGGVDDGRNPYSSLTLSGSTLYGMTIAGGDLDAGTIFSINTNGTGFTLLHEFAGGTDDGGSPHGYLIFSDSTLYGMTSGGGDSTTGTIFSINTDGTGFTLLHDFAGGNDDGAVPLGSLIFSGSTLYGMTNTGGDSDIGTIFSKTIISTDSSLSALAIDQGVLNPAFATGTFDYVASLPRSITSINVIPTANNANAAITVNGTPVDSGDWASVNLDVGDNTITIIVTAEDDSTSTYTIVVTRETLIARLTTYTGTGTNPFAIAFDDINMWTADRNNNSVTKISPTGVMTTYTGTGANPSAIAFDGVNMWTANMNDDSVTKISPTGTMTTHPGTGLYPYSIAFDGVNMWTANVGDNSVTKISPTGTMTTYPGTGINPFAIASDGVNMWTANEGNYSVTKISPTGAMTTYSGTGLHPSGIAFDGVNMWTANFSGNSVTKISPTGVMTTYTGTGVNPYSIAFDGVNMWTANNNDDSVTKISPTGTMTTYIGTGAYPYAIAFDGVNMWTADNDSNSVTKIDFIAFSTDSSLSVLTINQGTLTPVFDSATLSYTASVANDITSINITPTANDTNATITINDTPVNSGSPASIDLDVGDNTISVVVTATDEITTSTYTIVVTRVADLSFSLLHEFTGETDDGGSPYNSLTLSGSTLYGMTAAGGDSNAGTIFSMNTDGTDFTLLHEFTGETDDGGFPYSSLTLSGSTLYGTTYGGGDSNFGTIFSMNTDGTDFTLLHEFAGVVDGGRNPYSSLTLSGSTLYGMTVAGGDLDVGTIFSMNTDGTDFTLLHEFAGEADDGGYPFSFLTLSGSTLYGMTGADENSNLGMIFSMNTDGTDFTLLHEFAGGNDDGSSPYGPLTLSGSTLYGMTGAGGDSNFGTIFSMNTDGTDFTLLHDFAGGNDDSATPFFSSLTLSGSTLYGTTAYGGDSNVGTIFSMNTDGTDFTLLHDFAGGNDDGSGIFGSLTLSGSTLYGMTLSGGDSNAGTIFSKIIISSDSSLSALTIDQGTLTPVFDSATLSYTASVANSITSLNVTPTVNNDNATIAINGAPASSESPTSVDLDVGENTITIIVTAEDNVATSTYTIVVTRVPSSDSSLSALTIDQGTLTPVFDSATLSYTASVANSITSLNVTSTTTNSGATITVNDTPTDSGDPASVNLDVGENTITIIVTAEDDITTSTYTIVVTRASLYTITFDSAGGSAVADIIQGYGTAITSPADPTKAGYTFAGWSPAVPGTMPEGGATLIAQWTTNGGSVISGGGSSICATVTYSDWGTTCVNNLQFRNLLTQAPVGCILTAQQESDRQRICQITNPTTGTSDQPKPGLITTIVNILENIISEAKILAAEDTNKLLNHLGVGTNIFSEQASLIRYKIILDLDKTISADEKMTINDFIIYGTLSTKHLGAGERAAVINSYYQAYGKLPNSEAEWSDVIKIANGRWPSERNATAEAQAKIEFKKVYARNAVMTNNIDENAIMIIAYGLMPSPRNLNSEQVAIKTFKWVYGHNPVSALGWNIVRAIAYSGAIR